MRSGPRAVLAALALVAAASSVTACGEDEPAADGPPADTGPPAICADVDALTSSMTALGSVGLDKDTLSKVQAELDKVKDVAADLRDHAGDEFGDQAEAVTAAFTALGDSLSEVAGSPSSAGLSAVSAAVTTLVAEVTTLASDVQDAC